MDTTQARRHEDHEGHEGHSAVENSPYAIPQDFNVEVYQEPEPEILEPQVSEQLRFVHIYEGLNSLDLNDHSTAD